MIAPRAREQALFNAFANPASRQHFAGLLATGRGRERVIDALDGFGDLDSRYCLKLKAGQEVTEIVAALVEQGAPESCYALSSNPRIDGQTLDLKEALEATLGSGYGTFLCCVPRRLAYFEGEQPGERYLLVRT